MYDPQNVRMFLTSHFYGPFIGLAMALFLILLDFPADARLLGFAGLVCLFWPYCLAVGRVTYLPLSLLSLQHLCFVIMWASHGYGGLASPFLLWLAVVPLLAFLYLSPNLRLWALLIAMIAANTAGLALVSLAYPSPPIDPGQLRWLALVSTVCAAIYVSMMAVHFGRVLNSRDAIEKEMARHRETASTLDRLASELRQAGSAKTALLAGIGPRAQAPLAEIEEACEGLRRQVAARQGVGLADVRSITEATRYLADLVREIDRCGGISAADVRRNAARCDLKAMLESVATTTATWSRPAKVDVEVPDLPDLHTHGPLLAEAIGHVLGHLGQRVSNRPMKLSASRLPSETGGYVVIDMSREEDSQSGGGHRVRPVSGAVRGECLKLALASRILSVLGGKLDTRSGRVSGEHIRIELPVILPA